MAQKPSKIPRTYSLPHLRLERFAKALSYQLPPPPARPPRPDERVRYSHGPKLAAELGHAIAAARKQGELRDPSIAVGKPNAYFEVSSEVDKFLPDKGWRKDVRIGAVRRGPSGAQVGTLFVTEKGEKLFAGELSKYSTEADETASTKRIDQIEAILPGTVASLWMDLRPLPQIGQRVWWECWCWPEIAQNIRGPAEGLKLRVSDQRLHFPDFEVVPIYATLEDMERLLANTDAIEELRYASDTPYVFTHDLTELRFEFLDDLVARVNAPANHAPAVCLLDTGVAAAHPLLEPGLSLTDCHAVDEAWQSDDHHGHGTELAGIALFGDLTYRVADMGEIELTHRVESVKLLPPHGFPPNEPANLGFITQSAMSLPEIFHPERQRVFCMAITNKGLSGQLPTTWSAAMDRAAAGLMLTDGASAAPTAPPRLIVVAGGNVPDYATPSEAADLERYPIEDPGQAWNALTIGGFTDRVDITDPLYTEWTAAAEVGDRSPYSRTSTNWPEAPIKPELVFEAGNRALSPLGNDLMAGIHSLSLLTTNRDHVVDPWGTTWATSPAAAQAARMAAILMAAEPSYWPETIRALMVHSAEWTPRMLQRFRDHKGKAKAVQLAREFGYGVPSLDRALGSARGDLALVSQTSFQPFKMPTKEGKKGTPVNDGTPKFHRLHLYRLPWPVQTLEELGEKRVELKVTLSYFIEPSPGQIAPKTPARYRSHGLRFELQHHLENEARFLTRINKLADEDEAEVPPEAANVIEDEDEVAYAEEEAEGGDMALPKAADSRWRFGSKSRSSGAAGSLHCDVWTGPGAELAVRRTLAVYPVNGWWRSRPPKKRYNSQARYSLVMSLRCLDEDVDLHAEIETAIKASVELDV